MSEDDSLTSEEDAVMSEESEHATNMEITSDTTMGPTNYLYQTEQNNNEANRRTNNTGNSTNGSSISHSPIADTPSDITEADNNIVMLTTGSQDIQSRQSVLTLANLKNRTNFISSNKYIGKKTGMKYFWGPYGLGYYSNVSNSWINIYRDRIKRFNSLTKQQRKHIHEFISVIQKWEEKEVLYFFGMIGLKKLSFINIKNLIGLIISESCPTCLDIIYPLKERVKCISFECPGMCKSCRKEVILTCHVCKQKQEIKCPICLETRPVWASKILSCNHGICWICYGGALEKGHAIINCPQCRKAI